MSFEDFEDEKKYPCQICGLTVGAGHRCDPVRLDRIEAGYKGAATVAEAGNDRDYRLFGSRLESGFEMMSDEELTNELHNL